MVSGEIESPDQNDGKRFARILPAFPSNGVGSGGIGANGVVPNGILGKRIWKPRFGTSNLEPSTLCDNIQAEKLFALAVYYQQIPTHTRPMAYCNMNVCWANIVGDRLLIQKYEEKFKTSNQSAGNLFAEFADFFGEKISISSIQIDVIH